MQVGVHLRQRPEPRLAVVLVVGTAAPSLVERVSGMSMEESSARAYPVAVEALALAPDPRPLVVAVDSKHGAPARRTPGRRPPHAERELSAHVRLSVLGDETGLDHASPRYAKLARDRKRCAPERLRCPFRRIQGVGSHLAMPGGDMNNLVILGAGTAGTMMANKLAKALPDAWRITVVDRDDLHVYQPGLLFLPFGGYEERDIIKARRMFFPPEVTLNLSGIVKVEADEKKVFLGDGSVLSYDVLIVATGTRLVPEQTEGLTGPGWQESIFDFYTLEGAMKLRRHLERFEGGRMVVNIVDLPIKCPVAPLEFLFLADAYFTGRGMRDRVQITYATPLDGAFTKPRASEAFGNLLSERGIAVESSFNLASVDGEAKRLLGFGDRTVEYDLLVTIPLHAGSKALEGSGLEDELGFVKTDHHTLQTKAFPEVFALGDATNLPASKAGSVAHFQAEVLIGNVLRFIAGQELAPDFDGHANCFIETGHGKAMLIDFNYDTEPLPGKYPLPGVGPFDLLAESAANHWGKLAFKWAYWEILLKGKELPVDHRMLMAGKWS